MEVSEATFAQRIYTPHQILVASFFGTPIAAAWFAAANLRAFARQGQARRVIVLGIAATLVAMVVAFYVPESMPRTTWPLAYSFAIYVVALRIFEGECAAYLSKGGLRGSWWQVIGVSLLFSIAVLAVMYAIGFTYFYLHAPA
jgi:hypothetical protein